MLSFVFRILTKPKVATNWLPIILAAAFCCADEAKAGGPYWHVNTFNAVNLDPSPGNQAMWSGVQSGTPGYMTAPGYGNNCDDRLYWRTTILDTFEPTQVHLRFDYNYDTQPSSDFFHVEYEDAGTFVTLAQVSGSNKETSGEFVTPAVFDQTWIISPGHYGGPNGDQVVLRLRVTSDSDGSDQDGNFDSSGAVQVDNILIELNDSLFSSANFETGGSDGGWTPFDHQAVAEYVRGQILGGSYESFNIWMTDVPVDSTHVVRDVDPQVPDLPIPYSLAWVVMIDSIPEANWSHPCSWAVIDADLTTHSGPLSKTWPPSVWADMGVGAKVRVSCADVTPEACPGLEVPPDVGGEPIDVNPCLYAVLISGGFDEDLNHPFFRFNLGSVYKKIRELGFAKDNIFVYYYDGSHLDLDNIDGDDDHETGSDVTDAARKGIIRDKISSLCDELDGLRDVLFIYTTNHGDEALGWLVLMDVGGGEDGLDPDGRLRPWEDLYEPEEFGVDTRHCRVCRLIVTMDQCYSGSFISVANDGFHDNSVIYTATAEDEPSYGRSYMTYWEQADLSRTTMNHVHEDIIESFRDLVARSSPQMAEGTPGNGDVVLNSCCGTEISHVPIYTPLCLGEDSVVVDVDICNNSPNDYTYDLSFQGEVSLPAMWCTVEGPSGFTLLDATPVFVPSWDCATVRVKIGRPDEMTEAFDISCYTVIVTNVETTNSFRCHGSLWDRRDICALFVHVGGAHHMTTAQAGGVYYMEPGQPYGLGLRMSNTGSNLSDLAYQFEVIRSDMSDFPNQIVGLNGLPPGTPVTGTVQMPPEGYSTEIPVTVQFDEPDPTSFYELLFLADTNNDSVPEPLTSVGLRSVGGTVSAVLKSFQSCWDDDHVVVVWTLSDINDNVTFEVFRKDVPNGSYVEIRDAEITQKGDHFVFVDKSAELGNSYTYRINIIENGGVLTSFETSPSTPSLKFALYQNYPNPFNPVTTISFALSERTRVNLSIFDLEGKLVDVLADITLDKGLREVPWDGKDLRGNPVSSGIYFCRLKAGNRVLTRKMVLIK
jgi:hypothetical protein